ncbi:hypothetical protein C8A05DRAFT_17324 [Staphylotrichum tortipilum]|uniref:Ring-like domain-containing protein n=1 Tax=Staphylotrichum tortipilum TaxID=2831512 RepID=A0AAN6MHP1_9PEZI|nr:hypothetical protein C8A05DRAFT_17324 [Staphylotrichum longicolle]
MAPFFKKHKDAGDKSAAKGKAAATPPPAAPAESTPPPAAAATPSSPPPDSDTTKRAPLLNDDDEQFLERLISHDDDDADEAAPPLPPRPKTPDLTWDSDSDSVQARDAPEAVTTAAAATATKKPSRLSRLFHRKQPSSTLTVPPSVPPKEAEREWSDLTRMLAHIGITPSTATPPSPAAATLAAPEDVQSLLQQFLLILKDIMRGVPTAVDDLIALLEGRNDALNKGFEKLPGPMQKLVIQLPKKLTSTLAPEVLAAAAKAQGLSAKSEDAEGEGGLARFLMPKNLADLVVTPAIVKSMLKAIVNALKLRWPAFVGTSVLWSTAVVLLLFVLWYCHKRGKEERERLEREAREGGEAGKGEEAKKGEEGVVGAVVVVEPPAESPRS